MNRTEPLSSNSNHKPKPTMKTLARTHAAKTRIGFILAICLCVSMLGATAFAELPSSATSISFQGALNGPNGKPLPNGTYNLSFCFWDGPAPTGNAISTNVLVPNVPVTNGLASTTIPTDSAWFNGQTLHLGVSVNGGNELLPRVLITAVPYAMAYSGSKLNISGFEPSLQIANTADPYGGFNSFWRFDTSGWGHEGSFSLLRYINGSTAAPLIHADKDALTLAINPSPVELNASYFTSYRFQVCGHGEAGIRLVDYDAPGGGWWSIDPNAWGNGYLTILRWNDATSPFSCLSIDRSGNVDIGTELRNASLVVHGTTRTTVLQITSDRNAKRDFQTVDGKAVLAKLAAMPITTWAYTNAPNIRHLGPVSQDFQAAFGFGDSDKHIATVDADGVALAAIQGLNQKLEERDGRIRELEERVRNLEQTLEKAVDRARTAIGETRHQQANRGQPLGNRRIPVTLRPNSF